MGISFGLKCKSRTSSTYNHIPERTFSGQLKWNNDNIEDFRNSISNLSEIFLSLSLSLEQDSTVVKIILTKFWENFQIQCTVAQINILGKIMYRQLFNID